MNLKKRTLDILKFNAVHPFFTFKNVYLNLVLMPNVVDGEIERVAMFACLVRLVVMFS